MTQNAINFQRKMFNIQRSERNCSDPRSPRSCQHSEIMLINCLLYVFIFFQAEDGIRDLTVTGVQTCALPIYLLVPAGEAVRTRGSSLRPSSGPGTASPAGTSRSPIPATAAVLCGCEAERGRSTRSEERRGGEEGRSRGAADH